MCWMLMHATSEIWALDFGFAPSKKPDHRFTEIVPQIYTGFFCCHLKIAADQDHEFEINTIY